MKKKALVLGGGLQGVLAAFKLDKIGFEVTIVEKSEKLLNRASRVNEGKIHLGIIYANDKSFDSAKYMMKSAMCFDTMIEEIVGERAPWQKWLSAPFYYIKMKSSLLSVKELDDFYDKINEHFDEVYKGSSTYLGTSPKWLIKKLDYIPNYLNSDFVDAVWETNELSVEVNKMNAWILEKLNKCDSIKKEFHCEVHDIAKNKDGFKVVANQNGTEIELESSLVVNCTWEDRLNLDSKLKYNPNHNWTFRLKHALNGILPKKIKNIPSLTFVLGSYGDVVNFKSTSKSYVSWYPEGMTDTTEQIKVPKEWENVCNGIVDDPKKAKKRITDMLQGFNEIIPGLVDCTSVDLCAGVIYSRGTPYIDDINSEVHQRFKVGIIHNEDGYLSIDTGKLTSAPLHASELGKILN